MPKKGTYPAISRARSAEPKALLKTVQALLDNIEILNGARGKDNPNRALTLADFGFSRDKDVRDFTGRVSAGGDSGGSGDGGGGSIQLEPIQTPTGLTAAGAFYNAFLAWDGATYAGHAYTAIYRSTADDFGTAALIATSTISIYADTISPAITYYYWIRFVRIDGAEGPLNATAGTTAQADILPSYLIDQLSGQIRATELHASLTSRIDLIDATGGGVVHNLAQEIIDRDAADGVLQQQINTLGARNIVEVFYQDSEPVDDDAHDGELLEGSAWYDTDDGNRPYLYLSGAWVDASDQRILDNSASISQEATTRANSDAAAALRIDSLEATVGDPVSGVTASATAIGLMGTAVDNLGDDLVAVAYDITEIKSNITSLETGVSGAATAIGQMGTAVDNLGDDVIANAHDITVIESDITDLSTSVSTAATALNSLTTSVSNIDGRVTANASDISQVQIVMGEDHAAVQEISGVVLGPEGLSARWTVKTDVNNLVGGVGFYNDGVKTWFMVNAGSFSIINSANNIAVPFIVEGGVTYMNTAVIKDASIESAKIHEVVASKIAGGTITAAVTMNAAHINGGSLNINGKFTVDALGNVLITSGPGSNRMEQTGRAIKVFADGVKRVQLGDLTA